MEWLIFFKGMGLMILTLALIFGICYWIIVAVKKLFPNFRFWFKYDVLRRKYDEQVVISLLNDLENGVDEKELFKAIILSNKASPIKAREMIYIFNKLKMKGGIK